MGQAEDIIYEIQRTLLVICIFTVMITVPILAVFYYRWRKHPMLKARRAEWALVNHFLIMIATLSFGYDGWSHYPSCSQILFTNSVLGMLTLDLYLIRSWLLLYNWHVSKALCAQKADASLDDQNWWLNHTHLATDRAVSIFLAVSFVCHIACWLLFIEINGWKNSWEGPAEAAICTSPWLWFFGVSGVLAGLLSVAVYVSYNMRLVVDAFEIKNELITMGGTLLIGAFPFWFIAVLFPSLEQTRCFIIMLPLSVNLCALRAIHVSLARPLMMLYKDMKLSYVMSMPMVVVGLTSTANAGDFQDSLALAREDVYKNKTVDLRRMLDTNTGIANDFVTFLTKEFSVENWRYYSDVLHLRMKYGGWKASHAGRSGLETGHRNWFRAQGPAVIALEMNINRIYAMYLAESAPFEVNLNSNLLLAIRSCFGRNHKLRLQCLDQIPELLCRAQDEIYELMKTDSYERFKRTDEFDHSQLAFKVTTAPFSEPIL